MSRSFFLSNLAKFGKFGNEGARDARIGKGDIVGGAERGGIGFEDDPFSKVSMADGIAGRELLIFRVLFFFLGERAGLE